MNKLTELGPFSDYLIAIGIILLTFSARETAKAILKRFKSDGKWGFFQRLAAPLANLILVVGLHLFTEILPLTGKPALWVDNFVYIVTVYLVLSLVGHICMVGIDLAGKGSNRSTALQQGFIPILSNLVTIFVFTAGAIMLLKHFNYDVLSLLTALGVGSLAIGLAAKETLSNMISGFTLIIDRNLMPGNKINMNGVIGDVDEIGLRSTRIRTGDGNMLIVPNYEMVNTKILNLSLPSPAAVCQVNLKLPYSESFSKVKAVVGAVLDGTSKINQAHGRSILLNDLSGGFQVIGVSFWVADPNDSGDAISEVNTKILAAFEKEKIVFYLPNVIPPVNV